MFFGVSAVASLANTPTLRIGDPAPPLEVMAWLKGEPVTRFEPRHVYVVEFWATWCGPCILAIPHLSELAKKYEGQVTIIGVNVREGADDGKVEEVREFVEDKGDKMAYTVAMDDPVKKTVFDAWMTAGGSYGIPASYIVDQQGRMVWVGHPKDIDKPLAQVLNGTLDLAEAQALQDARNMRTTQHLNNMKVMQPIVTAQKNKDYRAVITEVDKLAARQLELEADVQYLVFGYKLKALLHLDENEAIAYARSKAKDDAFFKAVAKAVPNAHKFYWSTVSNLITQQEGLSATMYQLAVHHLTKAVADHPENVRVYRWQDLAAAYSRLGDFDAAIKAQQAAIAAAEKHADFVEDFIAPMRDTLADYQNSKG